VGLAGCWWPATGWARRGFPRAVNRLAAAALLATYTTHKTIADTTAVRAAITEVNDQ